MKTTTCLALALLAAPALAVQTPHETTGSLELAWETAYGTQTSSAEFVTDGVLRSDDLYTVGYKRTYDFEDHRWLVLRHDLGTGAEAWRVLHPGPAANARKATAASISDDGQRLFVAGTLAQSSGWNTDLGMVAMDSASGAVLWEQTYGPGSTHVPNAQVALGHAVYVTGLQSTGFVMLARRQSDGALLWAETHDTGYLQEGHDVAVLEEGGVTRVFAVGRNETDGLGGGGILIARSAVDGSLLWFASQPSPLQPCDMRVIDAAPGLVVVAGNMDTAADVRAYRSTDGLPLWSASFDDLDPWHGGVEDVAIDWTGTRVLVTGAVSTARGYGDLRTLCLDAATGAVLWQKDWNSPVSDDSWERGRALALCPCVNSVHVSGTTQLEGGPADQVTIGYDIATGVELWLELEAGPQDDVPGVAFAGSAKVAVAGLRDADSGLGDLGITTRHASTGSLAWGVQLDLPVPATDRLADLALDGERLLGAVERQAPDEARLVAWDAADGAVQWELEPTLTDVASPRRVAAGPLAYLAGRTLSSNFLQAVDPASGTPLWLSLFAGVPWGTSLGMDLEQDPSTGVAYTTTTAGTETHDTHDWSTTAWDPATGAPLWTSARDPLGYADWPEDLELSPDGARVFVTGTTSPATYLDIFGVTWPEHAVGTVAYDAATGTELWARDWQGGPGVALDFGVALAANADRVYVTGHSVGNPVDAVVTLAYDAATGAELWSSQYTSLVPGFNEPADLTVGAGRVYVGGYTQAAFGGTRDLLVLAYDAATGVALWHDVVATTTDDTAVELVLDPTGTRLTVLAERWDGSLGGLDADTWTLVLDAASGAHLGEAHHGGSTSPGTEERPTVLVQATDGRRLFAGGHDDSATDGTLDVQLSAYDVPYLVGQPGELSVATGGTHVLSVETDVTQAGRPFLVLGSLDEADPGIAVDGVFLPLVSDAYLTYTLTHPSPPWFAGSFSLLDFRGRGAAHLIVQPAWVAGLAGLVVHHAYLVFEVPGSGQAILASEAVSLTLTP